MSEPADMRSMLSELAERFGISEAMQTMGIFSAWARIVGGQVASRCEPLVLKEGILKVSASSAAWASELRYLSGEIARRVNLELGREVVKEVRVVVADPSAGRDPESAPRNGRIGRYARVAKGGSPKPKSGRLAGKTRKKRA